jgi:error-prone DNA polymerase
MAIVSSVKLLEVHSVIQQQDGALHLVAKQLIDRSSWLGNMSLHSRDFC